MMTGQFYNKLYINLGQVVYYNFNKRIFKFDINLNNIILF